MIINALAGTGKVLVAAGEQGMVLLSDNQGSSWTEPQVAPMRRSTLTAVFFIDEQVGVAVGHDGWIIRTTNGGASWTEVRFDANRTDPLLALWGDGRLLHAVGGFGLHLVSADAGLSWTTISGEDAHLNAISGDGSGLMLIAGEMGLLHRSTDHGKNWTALPPFYNGSLFGLLDLGAGSWLAYGMRGNIFRSDDRGASWQRVPNDLQVSLYAGVVRKSGQILVAGQGGIVLASSDGGRQFSIKRAGGMKSYGAATESGGRLFLAGEAGIAHGEISQGVMK